MQGVLDMEVGAALRKAELRAWVSEMGESTAVLGGILRVMHPATFASGLKCIEGIKHSKKVVKREHLDEVLEVWTSPYTTFSLINNRDTPLHRDNGGSHTVMDMLVSVGPYESGEFVVPGLGLTFHYSSGTVIGLLGRIVRHGAEATGQRLCFAQYLRENVLEALGISDPEWVNIKDIFEERNVH